MLLTDDASIRRVYEEIHLRLAEVVGLRMRQPPELRLVSMNEVESSRLDDPHALDKLGGLFTRDASGKATILLISPVTEARARSVLAHELAHAWQVDHCPDDQGRRLREGFAEWVSWKVIEDAPVCAKERVKIEGRIDDYGRGFRTFRGLEERHGVAGAVRYARVAQGSIPGAPPRE